MPSSPLDYPMTEQSISELASQSLTKYLLTPAPPPETNSEEKKEPETMSSYMSSLAVSLQNSTVNTRLPMSSSPSIYFWTHRSTTSDVVSMINTTCAISPNTGAAASGRVDPSTLRMERGGFKDPDVIVGRGVGGVNGFKVSAYRSPLETLSAMGRDEHERMNKALMDERNEFITKVKTKVKERENLERGMAVIIQRVVRGYVVRNFTMASLNMKLKIRAKLAQQMKDSFPGLITTKKQYAAIKKEREARAANLMGSLYRRYASIMKVEAIRQAVYMKLLDDSAAMIQKLHRGKMGKRAVQKERERANNEKLQAGAGMLQRHYRGFVSRKEARKIRKERDNNAVDVLQRGARGFVAKQKVKNLKKEKLGKKMNEGCIVITRFFRHVYGMKRGERIRNITLKFIRESSCVKIQCAGRKMIAKGRVKRVLFMVRQSRRLCAIIHIQRMIRGFVGRARAEKREEEVSEISEIFTKVRAGDEDGVEHFITFQDHNSKDMAMPDDVDHNGDTVLAIAAAKGLLQVMRKCLVWGTDPNLKNNDGLTAIDIAVRRFQPVAAEYLLSKVSVEFATEGLTLLHEASTSGMGRFAASLLEQGVNANCRDPIKSRTPMHDACFAALPEHKIFFDHQNENDEDFDEDEQATFATKHAVVVKHLLENGGDPTLRDGDGFTPLHYAAMVGNVACIENILKSEKGKRALKIKDPLGKTAWVEACLYGHTKCQKVLWEDASDVDNKMDRVYPQDAERFVVGLTTADTDTPKTYRKKLQALEKFDTVARAEKVQKLVTWASVPVDVKLNDDGATALMMAAKTGNVVAFETCLKMGAGLSRQDDRGRNAALYLSGTTNEDNAANQMLSICNTGVGDAPAAADIDVDAALSTRDNLGRSAIHYAAFRSNNEIISFIHGHQLSRCNIHSKDINGDTPMHFVCSINERTFSKRLAELGYSGTMAEHIIPPNDAVISATIRQLRKLGASSETENLSGKSALMTACYEGNVNAAKVLLADWKDMHNLSKSLVYSAYYAIQGGQISTLKIVCKHEKFTAAHAHSTGPEGVSLLGAAIQKNRLDLITYLLDDVQINPTKQCWNGGGNGLHACALWGTTEAIQLLIRHPKVVPVMYERKNQRGETPLVTAVAAHNYGACQELIKRGALTTGTGRMWCAAFLLSACLTQHVKGKTVMPKAMVWRGKKFFVFGLEDDPDINDIAADTSALTPNAEKRKLRRVRKPRNDMEESMSKPGSAASKPGSRGRGRNSPGGKSPGGRSPGQSSSTRSLRERMGRT